MILSSLKKFSTNLLVDCIGESRCGLGHPNYEVRCKRLGLDSLQLRRLRFDLCMYFKVINGKVDLSPDEFFEMSNFKGRGHGFKLAHVYKRTNVRKYSIFVTERLRRGIIFRHL